MTNEEKSLKIAVGTVSERTRNHPSNTLHIICVKDACLEMAQWKDEQLSKTIDELKEEYLELWTNNLNTTEDTTAKLTALNRLKQILLETNL